MKKSDLKDGMIVKTKYGHMLYFLQNTFFIKSKDASLIVVEFLSTGYDEELNSTWSEDYNIMEIYYEGELLWERPKEVNWTKVKFGTRVKAWDDEDENGNRDYEVEGKFLAYNEEYSRYEDDDDQLFLVYYEDNTGANAGWFQHCELIDEE